MSQKGSSAASSNRNNESKQTEFLNDPAMLFSAVLYGLTPEQRRQLLAQHRAAVASSTNEKRSLQQREKQQQQQHQKEEEEGEKVTSETGPSSSSSSIPLPNIPYESILPPNPEELKKTALYQSTYKLLQWQRDNYLVGREYADWRRSEREKEQIDEEQVPTVVRADPTMDRFQIPMDATAMGHEQISKLAARWIPTNFIQQPLTPLVASVPGGPLYASIKNATISLILGQQQHLDETVKNALLRFLQNPENRMAMKHSTRGFITTSYGREQTPPT